jgi:hypothetical protein
MRRRTAVILAGLVMLVSGAAALGGAGVGQAGPRLIDPFTLSVAPSPGNYGRHVVFTIDFVNASNQTLVHAHFHGTASTLNANGLPAGTPTYDPTLSTTSRGTCGADPSDPLSVTCDYSNLESGADVRSTFVYVMPAATSGAATARFDGTNGLTLDEGGGGGGGCTPGQQCTFSPTPSSVTVGVQAASADQASDVFGTQGGTLTTGLPTAGGSSPAVNTKSPAATTFTNPTGTLITIPTSPNVVPASILEGVVDPNVCGSGATPVLVASTVTVPGDWSPNRLGVALDVLAKALPQNANYNNLKLCHNGAVVPATKSKFKNSDGDWVFRLSGLFDSNGNVGGGF